MLWKAKEDRHKRLHTVWFYLCEMSRIGKSMETESMLVVPWVSGERMGVLTKESNCRNENVPNYYGDSCTAEQSY